MARIVPRAENGMKLCRHPEHQEHLPVSEFHKNKQTADGYHDYCKKCRKKIRAAWLEDNKEWQYLQNRERTLKRYMQRPVLYNARINKSGITFKVVRKTATKYYGWREIKHHVVKLSVEIQDCKICK